MIDIKQFAEIELRTAKILSAERVPETDKLMQMRVDAGGEERNMVAGIAAVYEPEQLVGKTIIIVANLEPATIRGVRSEGMLLAADVDGRPIVATFPEDVPPGKRVR
jgi:methionyl-tRNA synthetase